MQPNDFGVGIGIALTTTKDNPWGNCRNRSPLGGPMELGVFIPIGNNGRLISTTSQKSVFVHQVLHFDYAGAR
jgi:hypothetical protein